MRIVNFKRNNYKDYIKFMQSIYKNNSYYRDTITTLVKSLLLKKGEFESNSYTLPLFVYDKEDIVAVCILIHAENYKQSVQIAYFEAKENVQEAVDLIIDRARALCKEREAKYITVGMNGHVNYGLGLLCNYYNKPLSFGNNYNPCYYIEYFNKHKPIEYSLTSFSGITKDFNMEKEQRLIDRYCSKYTFRNVNFKDFEKEMKLYTDLNNLCFKDHAFYYPRSYKEDYELFKDLKLFLKEENIIFAEDNGKPIGFILWYPDYNELINEGRSIGIDTLIKYRILKKKINKFKIVEIGVIEEYHNKGVILGLFNECYKKIKGKYDFYETSWILDSNFKSKNFGVKWADNEYKQYKVFEIGL